MFIHTLSSAFFLLLVAACAYGAESPLTLAGNWSGTWTDSRKAYSNSGGDFTCVAVAKKPGVWLGTFNVGKQKVFVAELSGKSEGGRIVFDTKVSLGEFHGIYTFKGYLTQDVFGGEYDGPDEKGTF